MELVVGDNVAADWLLGTEVKLVVGGNEASDWLLRSGRKSLTSGSSLYSESIT